MCNIFYICQKLNHLNQMESISVFDMLSIGVGPSSSHTLGPWRAAKQWIKYLQSRELFTGVASVNVELFGSLALTGKGHATDIALLMGLLGTDPVTFDILDIQNQVNKVKNSKRLMLNFEKEIPFDFEKKYKV